MNLSQTDDSYLRYARSLANAGIINAQSDEVEYRLDDSITRAEMAKIAITLASKTPTECV